MGIYIYGLTLVIVASVQGANTPTTANRVSPSSDKVLENSFLHMTFDAYNGHLKSFVDKQSRTDLLQLQNKGWQCNIGFALVRGNKNSEWTDSSRAQKFTSQLRNTNGGTEFVGRWEYKWPEGGTNLLLKVFLPQNSGLSTWTIWAQNIGNIRFERFSFMLPGVGPLGASGQDDYLLVPELNGRLMSNPFENLQWWGQPYPSAFSSMQLMAYYDQDAGFYLASLDTKGLSKVLKWNKKEQGKGQRDWVDIGIDFPGLAETDNSKSFQTGIALGVFHGDWTAAATLYRDWAQKQSWAISIKNKQTPAWLTQTGISKDYYLHENNRSNKNYSTCVTRFREHFDYFSIPTIALLWGWEHGGTFAEGDYFPPVEGWEAFDRAVQGLHAMDVQPLLFVRGESILERSPAWATDRCIKAAIRNINGELCYSHVEKEKSVLMCLESREWIDYLKETITTLGQHNVSLVTLDGFPWCPLQVCHNREHLHKLLPGCAARPYEIANNLQQMRGEIKKEFPNMALCGEGSAEIYIPSQDICHTRSCWVEQTGDWSKDYHRYAQPVPLYNYIYHSNTLILDEYNLGIWDFEGGKSYHRLAIGRCFVWGEICSYNMQDSIKEHGKQPVFDLLKRCAQARTGYLQEFLVFGQMLPGPNIQSPSFQVEFRIGQFQKEFPSVLSSTWKAENGDIAIIILNIGDDHLASSVSLGTYKQYMTGGSELKIYINNTLEKKISLSTNTGTLPIELDSLQFTALILENPTGKQNEKKQ